MMEGFPKLVGADTDDPTPSSLKAGSAGKATIEIVAGQLSELAWLAEQHIIDAGLPVFQRGRRLVRPAAQEVVVTKGRTILSTCFAELGTPAMLDFMGRAADWTRYDARLKQQVSKDPPKAVAEILLSRFGDWRVPPVSGVITTPTLRPDHSILCTPGYDSATRLYLVEDPELVLPPIPAYPTRDAALAALSLLDGLLDGFPFVSQADRSVALSALLTPVCRGAIAVAPLHVARAGTAGTGKSYLFDLASAIATGRPCPVAAAGQDGDEVDKRLVGLLLAGFPIVSLDNVNGELGSDLLCQAVERPLIRLRRLGASDISELETRATIFATGNALRVRGDMTRRTLICDLDAQMERPELRTFPFDPVERVLAGRGRYVAAALTIVRAFVTSGAVPDMTALASYADYSATVRGALVWLGRPDPALTMERAREDDPELGELREVLRTWADRVGVGTEITAKAMVQHADFKQHDEHGRPTGDYANPELRDALLAIAGTRMGGIDPQRFGKWLRSRKGRIVSIAIRSTMKRVRVETRGITDGAARWTLKEVGGNGGQQKGGLGV